MVCQGKHSCNIGTNLGFGKAVSGTLSSTETLHGNMMEVPVKKEVEVTTGSKTDFAIIQDRFVVP